METAYHVKFYGLLQERIGSEVYLKRPLKTVAELRELLESTYPLLKKIPYLVAVNKIIATVENPLNPGAEIAILPPFSGG